MSPKEFQPVLTLRKQGTRPPLFCVHQHSGDVDVYADLIEALGEDQPVYGICSPALEDLSRLPASIEAAAAEVVAGIRKVQPQGAPFLVGFSWAGRLAFEVARQLEQQDGVSCFTAIIGSDAPLWSRNFASRLAHFSWSFLPWLWRLIRDRENRWRRLSRWKKMAGNIKQSLAENDPLIPDWVSSPMSLHMISLSAKYRPLPKSNVAIDLFRERNAYHPQPSHPLRVWDNDRLLDAGWHHWTRKPVRIYWLAGDHSSILQPPAVSGLAQAIREAMDQHIKRLSLMDGKTK